jgi:protein gp37
MSAFTKIQWCDSTVNPIMGCSGCELFTAPGQILTLMDQAMSKEIPGWKPGEARERFRRLAKAAYARIAKPHPDMSSGVTTTNIWHLRKQYFAEIKDEFGRSVALCAERVIDQAITCYAAKLHLNRGTSIVNPERKLNPGYAPEFTKLTRYPGRMASIARASDLLGTKRLDAPWQDGLPRKIFVSDMGDTFSYATADHFQYLREDAMSAIQSPEGQQHLWLWLTKRPHIMARFAEQIGGFPENVCAMTTLTQPDRENFGRLDALRRVQARTRGLSVEPLIEPIPAEDLDLSGIDWLILGGESGSRNARPFAVEWAMELKDHCRKQGVAFFLKQLGRTPRCAGEPITLKDAHGGDWSEWPEQLRVREFPAHFHQYRNRKEAVA